MVERVEDVTLNLLFLAVVPTSRRVREVPRPCSGDPYLNRSWFQLERKAADLLSLPNFQSYMSQNYEGIAG